MGDYSANQLNNKFKEGDFAKIMGTDTWIKEGVAGMVCKLEKKIADDQYGVNTYRANVKYSDNKTKKITITAAEINTVSMPFLVWMYNTQLYWRRRKENEAERLKAENAEARDLLISACMAYSMVYSAEQNKNNPYIRELHAETRKFLDKGMLK